MAPSSEQNMKSVNRPFKRLVHEGYLWGPIWAPVPWSRRSGVEKNSQFKSMSPFFFTEVLCILLWRPGANIFNAGMVFLLPNGFMS